MIEARNRTGFPKALIVEKRGRALSIPESLQDQAQIEIDIKAIRGAGRQITYSTTQRNSLGRMSVASTTIGWGKRLGTIAGRGRQRRTRHDHGARHPLDLPGWSRRGAAQQPDDRRVSSERALRQVPTFKVPQSFSPSERILLLGTSG